MNLAGFVAYSAQSISRAQRYNVLSTPAILLNFFPLRPDQGPIVMGSWPDRLTLLSPIFSQKDLNGNKVFIKSGYAVYTAKFKYLVEDLILNRTRCPMWTLYLNCLGGWKKHVYGERAHLKLFLDAGSPGQWFPFHYIFIFISFFSLLS